MVTALHAAAVRGVSRRQWHRSRQHRRDRLSRPDRAAPARREADDPDRRRPGAWPTRPAFAWSMICARPMSRPAGRARRWCRSIIARLPRMLDRPHPIAVLNVGGVANVTFINGVPDPYACDTGPGNALIDDFMRARKRRDPRREWRRGGARARRRGRGRARAQAFLLRAEAAEIARPQRVPRMGGGPRQPCGQERRGRRGDARGDHGGDGRRPSCRICRRRREAGSSAAAAPATRR